MASLNWSDEENDIIVADHFAMLADELVHRISSKTEHRRNLMRLLPTRSEGSIEFKHQNISAVLLGLGQPRIHGYKPAKNFQSSLLDAVLRRMTQTLPWEIAGPTKRMSEPPALWFGPSPTQSNAPPPVDPERMAYIARKFDVAERDNRNRALGEAGERLVFYHEKSRLTSAGRPDLSERVQWTSRDHGDGAGYDIQSFEEDESLRLIEVKTTNGWERTPFHISPNELACADENRDRWHLYRLWDFVRTPQAFTLRPPLQNHVALTPTSFRASLH